MFHTLNERQIHDCGEFSCEGRARFDFLFGGGEGLALLPSPACARTAHFLLLLRRKGGHSAHRKANESCQTGFFSESTRLGLLEQKWGWVHFCIFLLASYLLLSLSRLNFVLFLTHIFFGKRQPQKTRNHILKNSMKSYFLRHFVNLFILQFIFIFYLFLFLFVVSPLCL